MTDWAKKEIEIACCRERGDKSSGEWDYGCACYESALKAFQSLISDGHSGMSIGITKNILNRLIDGKPLTPIEDTPDVWRPGTRQDNKQSFQCLRMSSLFKDVYDDGRVEYHDVNRCHCVYLDDPHASSWYNGFISRMIHELYPITMPYYPASKPMVVHCTECLSDPINGDFDTLGVWYVAQPNGERNTIERFFKETSDSWAEISKEEYYERKLLGQAMKKYTNEP